MRRPDGRVRVGWRILWFLWVAAFVMTLTAFLLPGGVQSGALAMLTGSLVGGWAALALDGRPPEALGFFLSRRAGVESALSLGVGVVIAMMVVLLMWVAGGLAWSAQSGTMLAWFTGAAGALAFLALPAAAEEALLRGYPLQALSEVWGAPAALLVTSAVFGAAHLGNPEVTLLGVVNIAAAGVLLGVVYLRTGSLWWATGVHLGWNWAHGYLADLPVSGLEVLDAPLYDGVATGLQWVGGGRFGPEGSAVATVVVLAASVWCWRARWLRPSPEVVRAEPIAALRLLETNPGLTGPRGA